MTNDLFRIVYCSRALAADSVSAEMIAHILDTSRRNNVQEGVTGALLCSGGLFAQVLEGEFEAVQRTFERIQADERHVEVVLLQADTVYGRLFGSWAMGLAETDESALTNALLRSALKAPGSDSSQEVLTLLDTLIHREADWDTHAA